MSDRRHVGYVLKQYPRLSETFVLNEILGVEAADIDVSVFSLRHATEGRFHRDVASVRAAVHYLPDVDKVSFLAALRSLPDLRTDRLREVLQFVDLLPGDRQARLVLHAIELAGEVRRREIDHLHAHFLTVAAHTVHLAHLLVDVPYSVTAHAKDIYRHSVDWDVAARVAASAEAIVTVCDANLRYLAHRLDGTDARLVRVYNGLGPQDPPAPSDERAPDTILAVGRLVEKKGFDLLLDAIDLLGRRGRDVRCVIVGDGEERDALERQARGLGIEDRVVFTGPLPQHEVSVWMRRATLMAAPCRVGDDGNQDALPTVLLEALGAGLPVVTTPVAGIPEIVHHGVEGLVVASDDVQALAGGIDLLLANPAFREAMSEAGPHKLASTFDRSATIGQLAAVFGSRRSAADEVAA